MILELIAQEASRPPRERPRPPRHARPKGWTGPTMRAPSPPVADLAPYQRAMLAGLLDEAAPPLSPLNRASMRRRFSIMWGQATS